MFANGVQFLLLIRPPPCYSYIQSSPVEFVINNELYIILGLFVNMVIIRNRTTYITIKTFRDYPLSLSLMFIYLIHSCRGSPNQ